MKLNWIILSLAAFVFLISTQSCKSTKELSELTDQDIKIKMRKGGCFGKCPIYEIEIYEGGYVKFYGERFIDKLGIYDKQITKTEYSALVDAFEAIDFMNLPDEYESNIPDAPTISLFYRSDEAAAFKEVKGKLNRPKKVKNLQSMIENIVDQTDWNVIEKKEPEKEVVKEDQKERTIKSELIIEPSEGVVLSKWFSENKEKYGVRIIKKIAPNLNLWLITYDKKLISADAIIDIIEKDPRIKSVEFNKTTSSRTER